MNKIAIMPKAVAGIIACAGSVLLADDIAVGKWGRLAIDDATPGIGKNDALYLRKEAASISYAGLGLWTLPLGNVIAFGDSEIAVRSGTLVVENSATPDLAAKPPAELQKAAVWLDAQKNVDVHEIVNNGTSYNCVKRWYDVRETTLEKPQYGYAQAVDATSYRSPVSASYDGKNCVEQKNCAADMERSLMYKAANGDPASYNIRHAFFVRASAHENDMKSAPVLGNSSAHYFSSDYDSDNLRILAANGVANPLAYSCEYLLDGVYDDPTASIDKGVHLHEFTLPSNRTLPVDSIGRDGNSKAGGYRVHEILLFTEPLTVLERMRITAYLKAKWLGGGTSPVSVKTAGNGKVELGDGVPLDDIDVSGDGTVVVGSESKVAHLYSGNGKTHPSYALKDAGSVMEMQAAEYEYALSSQDSITVADFTKVSQIAKEASAATGCAAVSSARPFFVSKLDSGITNLTLSGGGNIVLRAPSGAAEYLSGSASKASISATALVVPQGKAGTEATVVVPENGDYELEFDIRNSVTDSSSAGGPAAAYSFVLSNGNGEIWQACPTAVDPSMYGNVPQHRRYLIRNLAAGEYVLTARGKNASSSAADVSDLSMALVVKRSGETVVPVKDGDFENSTFERLFFATLSNNREQYSGWKLANGGLAGNPAYQTIVSSAMGASGNYDYMFRSPQLGRYGDNSLVLYHRGGDAESPETHFVEEGKYRLRVDAVRWMTGTNIHKYAESPCNAQPVLEALVKINGGEPVLLGSISPLKFVAATYSFPIGVDIDPNDSVTVVLRQTAEYGAVQIDNLEFVKVSPSSELITNGSGENGNTGWNFDDYTDDYRHLAEIKNPTANNYGTTYCDGANAIRSVNGGRAWQTLALQAGVYRLSFWSRPREWSDGNISYRTRLTFWYAEAGSSVTNTFYESDLLWCTEFIERSALFSVPADGTYVFGFNSENENGKDSLVDCVSVKQVHETDAVPDISEFAKIEVSGGGKLRLDFTGCLNLAKVKINGSVLSGEISEAKYPQLVCGPGKVYVKPAGFVFICR